MPTAMPADVIAGVWSMTTKDKTQRAPQGDSRIHEFEKVEKFIYSDPKKSREI